METLDYRLHKQLYRKMKAGGKKTLDMDFGSNPDQLRTNYLDMYEGVHAEMIQTNRFDEKFRFEHHTFRQDKDDKRNYSQSRGVIPNFWTRLYFGKIVG